MKKIRYLFVIGFINSILLYSLEHSAAAQQNIPSLINKIQPAVVHIIAYDTIGNKSSQGSGFFINPKGEVITNWHVVKNTTTAMVKTSTGAIFEVKGVSAKDEKRDIIKLILDAKNINFPYLKLSSSLPKLGEKIIVFGSPQGLEATVTDGLVSGLRVIPNIGNIIQISAPISPGSSGGPVIDLQGKVVGIASFQFKEGQNLNFAYSAEDISRLIKSSKPIIPLNLLDTYEARVKAAERYAKVSMNPMIDSIVNDTYRRHPELNNEDLERLKEWFNSKVLDMSIKIMIKHFTVKELNSLADFYSSPIGMSMMKKFGPMMHDMTVYMKEDMMRDLEEGPLLKGNK